MLATVSRLFAVCRALMVFVGVLGCVPAAASAAGGPLSFSAPRGIDAQPPFAFRNRITGISCPSSGPCVAVDGFGNVLTSTNATGGSGAWTITKIPGDTGFSSVSCVPGFCAAADFNGNVVTSTDPAGGAGAWSIHADLTATLPTISCASASFCAIVDQGGSGDVWTSTTPTVANSFTAHTIDAGQVLSGISCPTASLCVAVDEHGTMLHSTSPATTPWTSMAIDTELNAVTCDATPFCVAVDGGGNVVHSNGGDLTQAWTTVSHVGGAAGVLSSVSCTSTACAAGDASGNIIGTDTPNTNDPTKWELATSSGLSGQLSAGCIAGSSTCLLGDGQGNIASSVDPGAGTWSTAAIDGTSAIGGIACPTASLCLASDSAGRLLRSTDPTGSAATWTRSVIDNNGAIASLACPSASLCVGVDTHGHALASTDPGGAWSGPVTIDGSNLISSVSCPSVSLCVAVDLSGNVVTSTSPSAGTWSAPVDIDGSTSMYAVSCPTASLCVAVDTSGNVLSSTNPTGGATAWKTAAVDAGSSLNGVTCLDATLCIAVDSTGNVLTSANPAGGASAWSAPVNLENNGNQLGAVACRPGPVCVIVDSAGNAFQSTTPATGGWSELAGIDGAQFFDSIACMPGLLCIAGDDVGNIVVGTPQVPANTVVPTITGTASVGATLSEKSGTWSNDPSAFSYQWEDCNGSGAACTSIRGATSQTYTVAASDGGHTIRVQETATNAGGAGTAASSAPTTAVPSTVTASPPAERAAPSISGAPVIGRRLHGSDGRWSGSAPLRFSDQWQRCRSVCMNIAGATGTTYVIRSHDHGFRIRLVVTVRDALGVSSATSAQTAAVVTVQQVRAALQRAITVHGETIAKLLAHGHVSQVAALVPGRVDVTWIVGAAKIAAGGVTYTRPGSRTLRLALTDAGKRILGRARGPVTVTIHGTFAPAGGGAPITVRVGLRLT